MQNVNYKGYNIEFNHVAKQNDPLTNKDNISTFICFHDAMPLGHTHSFMDMEDALNFLRVTKAIYMPLYLVKQDDLYHLTFKVPAAQANALKMGYAYVEKKKAADFADIERLGVAGKRTVLAKIEEEIAEYDAYLHSDTFDYRIINSANRVTRQITSFMNIEQAQIDAKNWIDALVDTKQEAKHLFSRIC